MPKPVKVLDNIQKHLTRSERAARAAAEGSVRREKRSRLRVPSWLSPAAREIFLETKRKLRGLQILDGSDTNALAIYSDLVSKYRSMSQAISGEDYPDLDYIKACQAWLPKIRSYEDSLGLTPNARARLARKKAAQGPVDHLAELLDDVTDYVNHD